MLRFSLDGQTSYDYDFLGQLIGADYSNTATPDESYTYDSNGNRLTANGDNYTTSTNNELTSDSNWTYTYDSEGNRISKMNATHRELYSWDYRNRLTSVTQQEWDSVEETWTTVQTIEYTYDYNNVWIRKTDGTNTTIFIPENYQTTVQIDNGTTTHHYLWTPQHQDKLLADTTPTAVLWSLTDHLGTIRDILSATETTHIIYDAYGNVISCTDSTCQSIDNPILFGYTGKAFDTSTHLQNNINRWYDSTLGRWLSPDPIGFNGGDANLYRYVGNKNLIMLDYMGLKDCYINVFIGHYGQQAIDDFIQLNKNKEGTYYTILSCYSRLYYNQIPVDQRIPGSPVFPDDEELKFKNAFTVRSLALKNSRRLARRLCGNYKNSCKNNDIPPQNANLPTDCSSVTIQFFYDADAEELYKTGYVNGRKYHHLSSPVNKTIRKIEYDCSSSKKPKNIYG